MSKALDGIHLLKQGDYTNTQRRDGSVSPRAHPQSGYLPDFTYNQFHNILRLLEVSPNFPFTTSETMGDYYL